MNGATIKLAKEIYKYMTEILVPIYNINILFIT